MGTPLSLEAQHLLKQMSHGQWRRREEVVNALAPAVAPGRALRRFERDAIRLQHLRTGEEPSDDDKIRMGQRRIAQIVIRSLRRRFLESETREGTEWIRKRDTPVPPARSKVFRVPDAEPDDELKQCESCGGFVLTSQQEDHDDFHAVNDAAPDTAENPKADGGIAATPGPVRASPAPPDGQLRAIMRQELTAFADDEILRRAVRQEVSLVVGGRQLRQMIRDELTQVLDVSLDDFQTGLTRFLNGWMDEVEKTIFMSRVTNTKLLGGTSRT